MLDVATSDQVGLFHASYRIGEARTGGVLFQLDLTVDAPTKRIQGLGRITLAVNPPLQIAAAVQGSYGQLPKLPQAPALVLVVLTGYPPIHWPPHGGIGPVILLNVDLRMVLAPDWKSGTASYRYLDEQGRWHDVESAPVKLLAPATV